MLRRGAQMAGLVSLGSLAAACGGDESQPLGGATGTGTAATEELAGKITMMNYPDWIGADEVANFEKAFPDVTVKQVEGLTSGAAAAVTQIQQNIGSYDMSLAGLVVGEHLEQAGLIQPIDRAKIPNLERIPEYFRQTYRWGIPTDYGKVGFGYRKDLMKDEPTSWADVWELAPKYDKKFVFVNYDVDVLGAALLYKGYDVNSADENELNEAKDALFEIKPHLLAFVATDIIKPMLQGDAVLTLDYDYDIAVAQRKNPNVAWVAPEEGTPAYLDGWVAIKETDNLDEVEAFMNFHLDPKPYADFINTTGSAYIMPDAEPLIDKSIVNNPSLKYDPEAVQRIKWERFLGPDATKLRAQIWEEVKAA
jgi:spermidine/putrescine-binding protein